jgi:SAM-dependent methyltransferase
MARRPEWIPGESWLQPFESMAAWERYRADHRVEHEALWQGGQLVQRLSFGRERVPGYCSLCRADVSFEILPDAHRRINFREQFICEGCRLSARARAVYRVLETLVPDGGAAVYATEQVSHGFCWLASRYRAAVGSEYFSDGQAELLQQTLEVLLPGAAPGQRTLRHEDVTALSFDDATQDAVVTCDVLEHVPDCDRALAEFARILRPGGMLILTVPFAVDRAETLLRAIVDDSGRIKHLAEPEYHGDPVNADGVLAYYTFGWDLLDRVRAAGFAEAFWCRSLRPSEGLIDQLWTLVAKRAPASVLPDWFRRWFSAGPRRGGR